MVYVYKKNKKNNKQTSIKLYILNKGNVMLFPECYVNLCVRRIKCM